MIRGCLIMSVLKFFLPIIALVALTLVSLREAVVATFSDPIVNQLAGNIGGDDLDVNVIFSRWNDVCNVKGYLAKSSLPAALDGGDKSEKLDQLPSIRESIGASDGGKDHSSRFDLLGWFQRELELSKAQQDAAANQLYKIRNTMTAELMEASCSLRSSIILECDRPG